MAVMPDSALDLERVLEAPRSQLIVITWQMLRTLGRKLRYAFSCLVVYFNLGKEGLPNFDLKLMFPRGHFILFESTSIRKDERRFQVFGSLIRTYDYPTAVVDGFMLPVRIERKSIAINGSELEAASENRDSPEGLRAEQIGGIASAFLDDFRVKTRSGIRQAVLVTQSRASMTAFAHELNRLADQRAHSAGHNALIVVQLASSADIHRLYSDRESLIVWLSTMDLLAGVDLGPSVACYVACKISQSAQHRLVSVAARPRINAGEAIILDYAGNQWDNMLAVKQ